MNKPIGYRICYQSKFGEKYYLNADLKMFSKDGMIWAKENKCRNVLKSLKNSRTLPFGPETIKKLVIEPMIPEDRLPAEEVIQISNAEQILSDECCQDTNEAGEQAEGPEWTHAENPDLGRDEFIEKLKDFCNALAECPTKLQEAKDALQVTEREQQDQLHYIEVVPPTDMTVDDMMDFLAKLHDVRTRRRRAKDRITVIGEALARFRPADGLYVLKTIESLDSRSYTLKSNGEIFMRPKGDTNG